MHKGDGKGQTSMKGSGVSAVLVPPPPPPIIVPAPQGYGNANAPQVAPPPDGIWGPQIVAQDTSLYAPSPAAPSDAEVRLKSLLRELKKAPDKSLFQQGYRKK